jgi:hypothetical protein
MSQQDLFSSETLKPEASPLPKTESWSDSPAPLWLQRVSIVILVVFCFYVGLLVFLLPWTKYWNENHYLLTFSPIGRLMSSGITRGIVSGLGLLDVWIGISEIIHYREHRV